MYSIYYISHIHTLYTQSSLIYTPCTHILHAYTLCNRHIFSCVYFVYSNIYLTYIFYVYFVYTLYVQIYTKNLYIYFECTPLCVHLLYAYIFYTHALCIYTYFIYTCTLIHASHISFVSAALYMPLTRNLYDLPLLYLCFYKLL